MIASAAASEQIKYGDFLTIDLSESSGTPVTAGTFSITGTGRLEDFNTPEIAAINENLLLCMYSNYTYNSNTYRTSYALMAVFVEKKDGIWISRTPSVIMEGNESGSRCPSMRKLLVDHVGQKFIAEYTYGNSIGSASVLLAGTYTNDFNIVTAEKEVPLPNSSYESGHYYKFPYKGGTIFDNHMLIISHSSYQVYYTDLDITDINNIKVNPLGSFGNAPYFYDAGDHKILGGINYSNSYNPDYRAECTALYLNTDGSVGSTSRLTMFTTGSSYMSAGQMSEDSNIITCPFTPYTVAVKLDRENHMLTYLGMEPTIVTPTNVCLSEFVSVLAVPNPAGRIVMPNGSRYLTLSYPQKAEVVNRNLDYTLIYRFPEQILTWSISGTQITLTEYKGGYTASVDKMSAYPQFVAGNSADTGEKVKVRLISRRAKCI